jgi:LIVCS family branched-chain amino acid:cation transporter
MFFGSGNLIFPLFVGHLAEGQWQAAFFGFWLTAVLLPFTGIIAMVFYHGNYLKFFATFGSLCKEVLPLTLLSVWIPLGSGPRCITLAYAALSPYVPIPSVALFSIAYCTLIWFITSRKQSLLDILGYFLTPLLLLCLGTVILLGIQASEGIQEANLSFFTSFKTAVQEGYHTMDLIAAFFFSASIISMLRNEKQTERETLKLTLQSCLVGMALLSIVYLGLIYLAACQADSLKQVAKDYLLISIAKNTLGHSLGLVAAFAVILACLTTSVALTLVYTEYLTSRWRQIKTEGALLATLASSFAMSIFGLSGITQVTGPLLNVFYPLLLAMIFWNLGKKTYAYLFPPSHKKARSLEQ